MIDRRKSATLLGPRRSRSELFTNGTIEGGDSVCIGLFDAGLTSVHQLTPLRLQKRAIVFQSVPNRKKLHVELIEKKED